MNREKESKTSEGIYEHFKGSLVAVIANAKHSETLEEMVVYRHLDTNELWVRPKTMFEGSVEHNGTAVRRFRPIDDA